MNKHIEHDSNKRTWDKFKQIVRFAAIFEGTVRDSEKNLRNSYVEHRVGYTQNYISFSSGLTTKPQTGFGKSLHWEKQSGFLNKIKINVTKYFLRGKKIYRSIVQHRNKESSCEIPWQWFKAFGRNQEMDRHIDEMPNAWPKAQPIRLMFSV